MANLSLVFDLIARDGASGPFKNVGNAAERAGNQTSKFGTAVSGAMKLASGALVGAGLVQGFKALYNAADESRKIGALTAQVIKSTGGAAQVSAKQVSDLAGAIAKKTGVDDEAIQSAQNLLLTFTNVRNEVGKGNDIFNQATATITDMSVALGQDTSSSAIQLGKALNDPIKGVTALQRVGVSFTASQKEQIKTLVESGDTLAAQKIILAELGKEFGGAAEAASTPLGKLQQRVGDLAEEMGGKLVPYVDRAATFLQNDLLPAAGAVGDVVGDVLGPALEVAGEALGLIFDAGKGAAELFGALPGPVQAVAVGLGAVALTSGPLTAVFGRGGLLDGGRARFLLFKDAVAGAVTSTSGFKSAVGQLARAIDPATLALGATFAALPLLVDGFKRLAGVTDVAESAQKRFRAALDETTGAMDDNLRKGAEDILRDAEGLVTAFDRAGISARDATDGLLGNADAQDRVSQALQDYITTSNRTEGKGNANANAAVDARNAYEDLIPTLAAAKTEQDFFAGSADNTTAATGVATGAVDTFTQGLQDTADAAGDARQQTDLFKQSLDVLTGQGVSLLEVQSQLQDALSAAADAITEEGGAVLDSAGYLALHTENGRKAADVLLDVRNSGNELIATMIQQGATTDEVAVKDAELRASFLNTAGQMGITGDNANRLADSILGIPSERNTTITADTTQPTTAVNKLQTLIDGLRGRTVEINVVTGAVKAVGNMLGGIGWATGGYTGDGGKYEPAGVVHRGEFVFTKEQTAKAGVSNLASMAKSLAGYAGGGLVAPASIRAELDASAYNTSMNAIAGGIAKKLEPAQGFLGALNWARSQVGKPYVWGGAGPGGYDCSGFMSAITNVIRGRSPHSRVGSTASFPWAGFGSGAGMFTIGSTPNAGNGIGHMAGTLLGVNVEATGGVGVKVGGSARGAFNGLFSTRAHLAMANGGVIGEPVSGIGHYSGRSYSFGERGPETVTPGVTGVPGSPRTVILDQRQVYAHVDVQQLSRQMTDDQRTAEFLHG